MNKNPTTESFHKSREDIFLIMKDKGLKHLPVVNEQGMVRGLYSIRDFISVPEYQNWVVIMAGGLGTRLAPLTDECPKPMLEIDDKPILEIIVEGFIHQGFSKFFISVNYMSEIIRDYFGDGTRWGVEIQYLNEEKRLGTSGALSLFPEKPKLPFIVINGDLLTKVDYQSLLDFHLENESIATMCVREYIFQVPYGVVNVGNKFVEDIVEKPVHKVFINAGIYCLNPSCLDYVPVNQYIDITTLFDRLLKDGKKICSFPVREYWLDIGQMNDLEKANHEVRHLFKK